MAGDPARQGQHQDQGHQHVTTSGITAYQCDMPFVIKNVPHEARYGFAINGVPGKIWMTNVSQGVTLSVFS
jgi:hypothetical protein